MATTATFIDHSRWHRMVWTALALLLVMALLGAVGAAAAQTIPTIEIVEVQRDQTVTIRTHNYPANRTFTVRMGPMGTKGINGTVVGTTDSGAGGTFDMTYDIPAALHGARQIAIRLDAPGGYYSYNWFFNSTTDGAATPPPATPPATPPPTKTPSAVIPTFNIVSVQRDTSVEIRTNNFPANQAFTVRMGALGTRGVNGVVVATTDSGTGGSFNATYSIPESLQGRATIAIRLESPAGYYAYNWFYNTTTP